MSAARFAPLLSETALAIKSASPNAKTLFGGTSSAWRDSFNYALTVQRNTESESAWLSHDYQAIHPYTNGEGPTLYGRDPSNYLKATKELDPGEVTIVDKFIRLSPRGQVWATELGWNSSKGSPKSPPCIQHAVTTPDEQALFIKHGFDVLLNDVPNHAVPVVFIYQFSDYGSRSCDNDATAYDNSFGLYTADVPRKVKPAFCQFLSYPANPSPTCSNPKQSIYLPSVVNRFLAAGR